MTETPRPRRTRPAEPDAGTDPLVAADTATTGVLEATTHAAPVMAGGLDVGALDVAALEADVSGQLRTVAPTFGNVLASIGLGVAESQTALDKGVITTVNDLAGTNITVVTDVIQHLNDDGEPDPAATQLVSTDLSVLNFFMPTIHEWKRVAVSMDLSVGAFSQSDGLSFNAKQNSGGIGGVGLFWGFLGVNAMSTSERERSGSRHNEQESSWSAGEVRLDATLGPRTTGKLPVPSQVSVGPQIVFSQGAVKEAPVAGGGVNRSVDVVISVRKAAGDVNPNVALTVDAGLLRTSFSSTAPFTGSTTNADGQIKVTVTRNVPSAGTGALKQDLVARLGAMSRTYQLTL